MTRQNQILALSDDCSTSGLFHTEVALDSVGVESAANSDVEINDSMISTSTTSGIEADGGASSVISIDRSEVISNGAGATAANSGSTVVTSDTKYAYNSAAALNQTGGTIFSFGTNRFHTNGATGTSTPLTQQ